MMTAHKRLWAIAALIVLSAGYAVLVRQDPAIASAMAMGYVSVLLTALLIINRWKKP